MKSYFRRRFILKGNNTLLFNTLINVPVIILPRNGLCRALKMTMPYGKIINSFYKYQKLFVSSVYLYLKF